MIKVYTGQTQGEAWLSRYRGKKPVMACILGFTATGLIPGISAAGATPAHRRYTAIADGEFLLNGPQPHPQYPLPPLRAGASPVLISRAVVEALGLPVYLFNAGLPVPPSVSHIDLDGQPAACLSSGQALPLQVVEHLWKQGLVWGHKLGKLAQDSYLILAECVVGGTTTALALLTALGLDAHGKVNSSHPHCNHGQKWQLVQTGLVKLPENKDPKGLVAAIGDPMQIFTAALAIAASSYTGIMLGGGTQMLAVYALILALLRQDNSLEARIKQIVVGTTRWVVEDSTGDTLGLVHVIRQKYSREPIPVIATQLNFRDSTYESLRAYEQGYVKEGVGAGACAIAASLYQNWSQTDLQQAVENLASRLCF